MVNDPANLWPGIDPGVDVIHRTSIVRLGVGGPELYYPTNHGALGFTSVADTGDGYLTVYTDFGADEICLYAAALPDLTLAAKEVTAGASGGASVTKYGLYSPQWGTRTASGKLKPIPPADAFFDLATDNLWIHHISARLPIGVTA